MHVHEHVHTYGIKAESLLFDLKSTVVLTEVKFQKYCQNTYLSILYFYFFYTLQ